MRNILVAGFVGFGLLAGCSTPSAGLKIEPPKNKNGDAIILLGTLALPNAGMQKWAGNLSVTDGELSCEGSNPASIVDVGWAVIRMRHDLKLTCDDGRTGSVQVSLSGTTRENMAGVGVGKLSDGSKLRLIVGDAVGTLPW
ncbi:hypothetical protein N8928_01350 [Planktomarina temperata]|nr:hypothetical protein [Planktomarina temperata]